MEWQVLIVGGSTLLGLMYLIGRPILALNKNITELCLNLKHLNKLFSEFKNDNVTEHKWFQCAIDDHEKRLMEIKNNCKIEEMLNGGGK